MHEAGDTSIESKMHETLTYACGQPLSLVLRNGVLRVMGIVERPGQYAKVMNAVREAGMRVLACEPPEDEMRAFTANGTE